MPLNCDYDRDHIAREYHAYNRDHEELIRLDRERFLMTFSTPPAVIAARQVQIYCLHHMKVVAPGYRITQNPYGHKTFTNYMNQHGSAGLGFAYVDTEDDCVTVYPPAGLEPATLDEFLVTDADFDLGEIVRKDNIQVSRKWYDIQIQAIQRRDVGRYDKMQDSRAKKLKGGVPDLSTPEARSGMAKKRAQVDADAEHRSNKRRRGETETWEGTPVSVRGAPSERDGTETPLLPFASSSSSFGGSVARDATPPLSAEDARILADINKEADVEVEKRLKAKELKDKELKEKESSKMVVD
ncbi:hypothetical protein DFH08DRAFT_808695 [Mycena albidolilacea]|uniref:Uncharacterized protein n=1 Tax=Mycena albidolilacea TaxID=1033008 RepID=A0AAD7A294_9AGAR|nr:hypothetical protein DFH08DRAFT_808695 [Mycena albidolilacea]